jgi:large subunit ribosomal protein L19
MSTAMEVTEQSQLRSELPDLRVGSNIRVNYRISEGNKERIQAFEGVIIGKHGGARNNKATFTVRKVTQGYGVERIFPLHSPRIESIEVLKVGKVRQSKLYYLRARKGKAARIKERINVRPAEDSKSDT